VQSSTKCIFRHVNEAITWIRVDVRLCARATYICFVAATGDDNDDDDDGDVLIRVNHA